MPEPIRKREREREGMTLLPEDVSRGMLKDAPGLVEEKRACPRIVLHNTVDDVKIEMEYGDEFNPPIKLTIRE